MTQISAINSGRSTLPNRQVNTKSNHSLHFKLLLKEDLNTRSEFESFSPVSTPNSDVTVYWHILVNKTYSAGV